MIIYKVKRKKKKIIIYCELTTEKKEDDIREYFTFEDEERVFLFLLDGIETIDKRTTVRYRCNVSTKNISVMDFYGIDVKFRKSRK